MRGSVSSFYRKELFFSEVPRDSREEVIHWLCNEMEKVYPLPKEACELVLEREALGGTDFGNYETFLEQLMIKNMECL